MYVCDLSCGHERKNRSVSEVIYDVDNDLVAVLVNFFL